MLSVKKRREVKKKDKDEGNERVLNYAKTKRKRKLYRMWGNMYQRRREWREQRRGALERGQSQHRSTSSELRHKWSIAISSRTDPRLIDRYAALGPGEVGDEDEDPSCCCLLAG